jgi:hypothetical protein
MSEYSNVKYVALNGENVCLSADVGDKNLIIPLSNDNRHYAEIMRQVKEEGLTIKDAD